MLPNRDSYFGNYNPHAPKHVKPEENSENSPATGWGGEEGLSAHPFQGTKPEGSWLAPLWLPTACRRKVQELVPKTSMS